MEKAAIPKPAKTHGHHIEPKKSGNGGVASGPARDSRDILLCYGIKPYWARENLAYAPFAGHSGDYSNGLHVKLLEAYNNNRSRAVIEQLLIQAAGTFCGVNQAGAP